MGTSRTENATLLAVDEFGPDEDFFVEFNPAAAAAEDDSASDED